MILKRFFYAAVLFLCLPGIVSSQNKGDKKNGNPIFAGWYADPEGIIYGYILLFLYYMVKMLKNTVRI